MNLNDKPEAQPRVGSIRLVRRFHWQCTQCRTSGAVAIPLPMQMRRLHQMLEDAHAQTHPFTCCPSNYFELTDVTPNDKLTDRRENNP